MLPTVDLSNFVKKAFIGAYWTILNPITWVTAAATTTGGLIYYAISDYLRISIPQIVPSVSLPDNTFFQFVNYVASLDVLFSILHYGLLVVLYIVEFLIYIVPSFFAALLALKARNIIADTLTMFWR